MDEIDNLMQQIALALPEISQRGAQTIREVCLVYDGTEWQVLAGGHSAVHIGEWGGDFNSWGVSAVDALQICLRNIKDKR